MGLFDSILGRSKPAKANLDVLFSVPQAALTLQANGFAFAGSGAVCYRPNEGVAFAETETDAEELLNADDGPNVERVDDRFGFRWLTLVHQSDDVAGMVTDLHAVNSSLTDAGFGQALLCSTVNFATADNKPFAIVYLYKRGRFIPSRRCPVTSATTPSNCSCVASSPPTYRSKTNWADGWRSGAHPVCEKHR